MTMKKILMLAAVLSSGLAACGPGADSSVAGDGDGDGGGDAAEDDGADGFDVSWALGVFHNPDHIRRGGVLTTYELRADGTGQTSLEDCVQGVLDEEYEEFSWRSVSDEEIELFPTDPSDEKFDWIRGDKELVTLVRVADGVVSTDEGRLRYERGKLCVLERPPVEDCSSIGMDIGLCEGAE